MTLAMGVELTAELFARFGDVKVAAGAKRHHGSGITMQSHVRLAEPVIREPARPVGLLKVGVKTDDFCVSRNRLLIAACRIQRLGERTMA